MRGAYEFITISRQFETSDEWKVFGKGNIPQNDGWITWAGVEAMAKSMGCKIPNEYWLCSLAVMRTFKPPFVP